MAQRLTGKVQRLSGVVPPSSMTRQRRRAAVRAEAKLARSAERLAARKAKQSRKRGALR